MSGETTTTPGKTWDVSSGEKNDLAKLNLGANPSVRVNEGAICTRELGDFCVTSDKLDKSIIDQIQANATITDGSITSAMLAPGSVTFTKLAQDVLDQFVRRDTIPTTVGAYLRYVSTDGITEEVSPSALIESKIFSGSTTSTTFSAVFTKTAAQKWQELVLYGTLGISSSGIMTITSIVVSGSGGTSAVNYVIGQSHGTSTDSEIYNTITTVIPFPLNFYQCTIGLTFPFDFSFDFVAPNAQGHTPNICYGSNGVNYDLMQRIEDARAIMQRGDWMTLKITNTTGRMRVHSIKTEAFTHNRTATVSM